MNAPKIGTVWKEIKGAKASFGNAPEQQVLKAAIMQTNLGIIPYMTF